VYPGAAISVTVGYTLTLLTPFMQVIVPEGTLMLQSEANGVILAGAMQ